MGVLYYLSIHKEERVGPWKVWISGWSANDAGVSKVFRPRVAYITRTELFWFFFFLIFY